MRYTQDGTPVTSFSVATSNKYNKADGTPVEETVWFRVSAWRRQAETCNEYLRKGSAVLVEGRLTANEFGSPRIWQTSAGESRASFELQAQTVKFLPGRGDAPEGGVSGGEGEAGESEVPF